MKKHFHVVIIFLALLVVTIPISATARGSDGNNLKRMCDQVKKIEEGKKNASRFDAGMPLATIGAYSDAIRDIKALQNMRMPCMPVGVNYGQREAVVRKYLEEHPEKWHLTYQKIIIEAMLEAFPCND